MDWQSHNYKYKLKSQQQPKVKDNQNMLATNMNQRNVLLQENISCDYGTWCKVMQNFHKSQGKPLTSNLILPPVEKPKISSLLIHLI